MRESTQHNTVVAAVNQKLDQLDDPRDSYRLIKERILQLSNDGKDVPEDLTLLEQQLMRECMAQSQGR